MSMAIRFLSPLRGFHTSDFLFSRLTPGATICRPSGAKERPQITHRAVVNCGWPSAIGDGYTDS